MNAIASGALLRDHRIDVIEPRQRGRAGTHQAVLDQHIKFDVAALASYAFKRWDSLTHDALLVAAAIEFADRLIRRPGLGWARRISLRIPVHDRVRWARPEFMRVLEDAAGFLTGDFWSFEFLARKDSAEKAAQTPLPLSVDAAAVLPFSDGMDSLAAGGIEDNARPGQRLMRVRLGGKSTSIGRRNAPEPFSGVPYQVRLGPAARESSMRSRGFKFAMISGIAAYLAGADEIVVPESGQGILGVPLVTVGHAYPDYRNHPLFLRRMELLLNLLFHQPIRFRFPRIWYTKGQTLRSFVELDQSENWKGTKSCWQGNRWASVNGTTRQCGVCAACMLRRMSVHAAGLNESDETYLIVDLSAPTVDAGADTGFTRITKAFREYAIAGVLHMDHMAELACDPASGLISRHAFVISPALDQKVAEVEAGLHRLFATHAREWRAFVESLGPNSFVRRWARAG